MQTVDGSPTKPRFVMEKWKEQVMKCEEGTLNWDGVKAFLSFFNWGSIKGVRVSEWEAREEGRVKGRKEWMGTQNRKRKSQLKFIQRPFLLFPSWLSLSPSLGTRNMVMWFNFPFNSLYTFSFGLTDTCFSIKINSLDLLVPGPRILDEDAFVFHFLDLWPTDLFLFCFPLFVSPSLPLSIPPSLPHARLAFCSPRRRKLIVKRMERRKMKNLLNVARHSHGRYLFTRLSSNQSEDEGVERAKGRKEEMRKRRRILRGRKDPSFSTLDWSSIWFYLQFHFFAKLAVIVNWSSYINSKGNGEKEREKTAEWIPLLILRLDPDHIQCSLHICSFVRSFYLSVYGIHFLSCINWLRHRGLLSHPLFSSSSLSIFRVFLPDRDFIPRSRLETRQETSEPSSSSSFPRIIMPRSGEH